MRLHPSANISQPTAPETRSSELRIHLVRGRFACQTGAVVGQCQGRAGECVVDHAVGRGLAQAMGTTKHGVKQVDRLLST